MINWKKNNGHVVQEWENGKNPNHFANKKSEFFFMKIVFLFTTKVGSLVETFRIKEDFAFIQLLIYS